MIIITSAAYVSDEIGVEIGNIPPSFLPIGNKRFYELQFESLRSNFNEKIFLSIPVSYRLTNYDRERINYLGINLICVPEELSLSESVLYVINSIGIYDDPVKILHGDTYLKDYPQDLDCIAISSSDDNYNWESEEYQLSNDVWCGFFAFSDIKLFIKFLTLNRINFVEAVRSYQLIINFTFFYAADWLDIGHVNTYFRSRSRFTTERSFNNLTISSNSVKKTGISRDKILAEAAWFINLPTSLKTYVPQLISYDKNLGNEYYEIEYLPLLPLNELFVNGLLDFNFWSRINKLLSSLLHSFESSINLDHSIIKSISDDFSILVVDKTLKRISEAHDFFDFDLNAELIINGVEVPSLNDIISHCQEYVLKLPPLPSVIHGDLCFSNILFDSRLCALKIIDPRGLNASGERSIYGDLKYDIAKIVHSYIGLYDFIIAGRFKFLQINKLNMTIDFDLDDSIISIQNKLLDSGKLLNIKFIDILPLVVLLFISMIPLHADNPIRQKAFFANSLRVYLIWKGVKL